jgi:hypothetical protein
VRNWVLVSSADEYPVFPASILEEAVFSPMHMLSTFLKIRWL